MNKSAKLCLLFCWISLCFNQSAWASHIVGGEMTYECLGNNRFKAFLNIYTDCAEGTPDSTLTIFVINNDGNFVTESFPLVVENIATLSTNSLGDCVENPNAVCIQKGSYVTPEFMLERNSNGYRIVYQRCCRNTVIDNIVNPAATGATYEAFISWKAFIDCNNGTIFKFNADPPNQLCANVPIEIDISTTNLPNIDSIKYSLCAPYFGGGLSNSSPNPPQFYDAVAYAANYDDQLPLGQSTPFIINPTNGTLNFTPTLLGNFTVGICAIAYQDGIIYNKISRDFQFNVYDCLVNQAYVNAEFSNCNNYTVSFNSNSDLAESHFWDFGVPGILSDTSNLINPTYTFADTGVYQGYLIVNKGSACEDTGYFVVNVFPELIADFSFEGECFNYPVVFTDASSYPISNLEIISWEWKRNGVLFSENQQSNYTFDAAENQTIELKVTAANGCVDSLSKTILLKNGPIANFGNDNVCLATATELTNTSLSNGVAIDEYIWQIGTSEIIAFQPTVTFNTPGNESVTLIAVTQDRICSDTFTQNVVVAEPLEPIIAGSAIGLCLGDTLVLTYSTVGVWDSLVWQSPYSIQTNNENFIEIVSNSDEDFNVELTVFNACGAFSTETEILVYEIPLTNLPELVNACTDNILTLPFDSYSVLWSNGDTTESTTISSIDSIITVIIDNNGCQLFDSVAVYFDCPVLAPSAFSPNDDGLNDVFKVFSNSTNILNLKIYNVWGEMVFNGSNELGWDGKRFGQNQPIGAYSWFLEDGDQNNHKSIKGSVLLIR